MSDINKKDSVVFILGRVYGDAYSSEPKNKVLMDSVECMLRVIKKENILDLKEEKENFIKGCTLALNVKDVTLSNIDDEVVKITDNMDYFK